MIMVKLIIKHGSNFTNSAFLASKVWEFISSKDKVYFLRDEEVNLGVHYCKGVGVPITTFKKDPKYGDVAEKERYTRMLDEATDVLVFWDGKDPDVKSFIDDAKGLGKNVSIFFYRVVRRKNISLNAEYDYSEPLDF